MTMPRRNLLTGAAAAAAAALTSSPAAAAPSEPRAHLTGGGVPKGRILLRNGHVIDTEPQPVAHARTARALRATADAIGGR